ncbi:MAG: FAD-binding oxidoreductase, partial [Rhodothermales bacterium]|nr:FAD-binding oxidoreductase [Rhodothermales bacterium]
MPTPPQQEHLADFAAALRPRLAGDLRLDPMSRALYATDASMYQIEPVGVLLPRHTDDVRAAVEAAAEFGLPVLPRGAGSSLAGSAVGAALVIDTSRWLDEVVEVDPEARTARVQPGAVLDGLNAALLPHGLQFGPDPASSNRCTLGGMIGTNATGTHSIRYGSVVDHVVQAEALLPDGTAVTFRELDAAGWRQKLRRDGAEGRLYRDLDALLAEAAPAIREHT